MIGKLCLGLGGCTFDSLLCFPIGLFQELRKSVKA
jgi:hypothetical protein